MHPNIFDKIVGQNRRQGRLRTCNNFDHQGRRKGEKTLHDIHLGSKCLALSEDRNEGGRFATPTIFLECDSYDMKSLQYKFCHDIFTGFKLASP